jgi:hypothetical protein
MFEQFFDCEDNCELFKTYDLRQEWAVKMLDDCKFTYKAPNEVSVYLTCVPSHISHQIFLRRPV